MSDAQRLATIRAVHTTIYVVMAVSTLLLVYAGVSGHEGLWLWIALALVTIETIIFAGNGFSCPLTVLARRYGAPAGHAFDTLLSERTTRLSFLLLRGRHGHRRRAPRRALVRADQVMGRLADLVYR